MYSIMAWASEIRAQKLNRRKRDDFKESIDECLYLGLCVFKALATDLSSKYVTYTENTWEKYKT